MSTQAQELKARMMAEAEAAIDRLLAGAGKPEQLTLSDIERLVRGAGQRVMEEFTRELAEAGAKREEEAVCPECKGKLRYKGQKERPVVTETGEMCLRRAYYYCPSCRKGFFPPGSTLGAE
jgi:hypothetical protein